MSGRGKAWSPEEDAYIREHYRQETFEEMGAAVGRSAGGVQYRCYRLGLYPKRWTQAALSIAAKWLEQAGACTHYAGYTCDKDFTTPGVCAACIRRHLMKLAREEAGKC